MMVSVHYPDEYDMFMIGGKYKRCAIDTLWYVTGKPGAYQIHHRLVDENDEDSCLDRAQCHLDDSDLVQGSCQHCGAKKWNILGDAQTGYILTEDNNKYCLKRFGNEARMIKCDKGYSGLSLQCTFRHHHYPSLCKGN